ncbi:Na+/H+ antiporter subunit E [Rehaibacterium terrae]|jgi:multicomponent Na+:H+ antiporter subunit E|uniref:Multicomponent Na+:H+ antiporter subunit E n=1 Tax=Rehaibacterium terrae TaxID=1341696 RepID=A0A7W7V717_9GAMM|nr:Na+/H+ antiporter subunit E [Rehaibacterium terrae]MBB5014381.1 multicomponent Na+:H+ antiporter subunit E [Rehaibacterium terrae]
MTTGRSPSAGRGRSLWAVQTLCLLLLVWLALDGAQNLWVGLVFAALGALAGAWLAPGELYRWRPWRLPGFCLYFLRESLRGGIDVAWRALHPRLPIKPCFERFVLDLPAGLPRTLMVSTVSLLPGTLSVSIDDDGALRVHALMPGAFAGVPELQRRIHRLFSLDGRAGGS